MRVVTAFLLLPVLAYGGSSTPSGLDWLAGCWVSADRSSHEVWVIDSDDSLIGFNVSVAAGKVAFYELLSIKQDDNGNWTFIAHPSGQASASFIVSDQGDTSVAFTNPDHDYPQVIRYQREGDRLHARVSLLGGEDPISFDKVACD